MGDRTCYRHVNATEATCPREEVQVRVDKTWNDGVPDAGNLLGVGRRNGAKIALPTDSENLTVGNGNRLSRRSIERESKDSPSVEEQVGGGHRKEPKTVGAQHAAPLHTND